MALSGTLDTFTLPDVLRLLASTSKTGRLRLTGQRGSGSIWLDDGQIAAAELSGDPISGLECAPVLFGLLRFEDGSFTFEDGSTPPISSDPESLENLLTEAESMLSEWREIEKVVPSMDVWVGLCDGLDGPDVMIDAERWRGIVAIGSGSAVGDMGGRLDLHEVAACRLAKELIELGLAELIDAPEILQPEAAASSSVDEAFTPSPAASFGHSEELDDAVEVTDNAFSLDSESDDSFASEMFETADDDAESSIDPLLPAGDPLVDMAGAGESQPRGGLFAGDTDSISPDDAPLDPAEIARQLANLSPRAAKAVAEAARATNDVDRDAALAAVEAEDQTVSRSLLLKFLGSVDS